MVNLLVRSKGKRSTKQHREEQLDPREFGLKKELLTKYEQTEFSSIIKGFSTMTRWDLGQDAKVVKHTKVNQHNTAQ